jgi:FtsH-binding integral membrane protein
MSAKAALALASKSRCLPDKQGNRTLFAARGFRICGFAATCWIALGLESILRPQQANYRDAVWMVPWVLTAIAFWLIHRTQRSPAAWLERVGFYAVMIASVLALLGNVGLLANQPALAVFGFPWGAMLWTVALIVFGIGTLKAGILPRSAGIALMLLEPGSILTGLALSPVAPLHERGAYSGGVEKGVMLALISFGLLSVRSIRYDESAPPAAS